MADSLNSGNVVYYFSGTGNSYHVAKRIAYGLQAELRPIVSLHRNETVLADVLCFVFPVYEFKPPRRVSEIIEGLDTVKANHVVAIATYGVALHRTLKVFNRTLKRRGLSLARGYGIKSPHNAVGSLACGDEEVRKRLIQAEKRVNEILQDIESRTAGSIERTSIFEDMTIIKQMRHIFKLLFILLFRGSSSLAFRVTGDCIACGQCQAICPVENIEFKEGVPVFKDACVSCFACLQWCPESAIRLGDYTFKDMAMRRYTHPSVRAFDLIADLDAYSRFVKHPDRERESHEKE
jgi:ferredoxin